MKSSFPYILNNKCKTIFDIVITANFLKRLEEHYNETASNFTKKYSLKDLIYFE